MSRIYNSPSSSRSISPQSSSRASRLRAMSVKSGVTMMTTNSVEIESDVFRENYFKAQSKIEEYKRIRDDAEERLRKLQVEYEFKKREIMDFEYNLNVRESILDKREKAISDDEILEIPNLQHNQAINEQKRESKIKEIDEIKSKIDEAYSNISKVLDKTVQLSTIRNDIPLLKAQTEGLLSAIRKKTNRIMELEENTTKQANELNRLRELENEYNKEKNKLNEAISAIDTRRLEAIRTLADPIDSTEFEEKAVEELEKDADEAESRYENIKKSDERDDTAKILSQIEKTEQQNAKRKVLLENKKKVLENQKKFRERRFKDDQRRIQQQKESLERLKKEIAEAEQFRKNRETKDAEEDEIEEKSLPTKRYIPASSIRDEKDLYDQIKQFEQQNQDRLNQIMSDISKEEQKFKKEREIQQEKWKRFMNRIDTYTKRLSKKEALLLSISEIEEQNEELEEKLKTLVQSKEQISRRKHANLSKRSEKSEDISFYDQYSTALKLKQSDIAQKKVDIQVRKKEIEKRNYDNDKLEQDVIEKQKKVAMIEKELAEYKKLMSDAVDNLNIDQEKLEDTVSFIEQKQEV